MDRLVLLKMLVAMTDTPPGKQDGAAIYTTGRGGTETQNCDLHAPRMPLSHPDWGLCL